MRRPCLLSTSTACTTPLRASCPSYQPAALIVVVASEVGAWAVNELPPQLQQTLTSPDKLDWRSIQRLEADWLSAYKGQPCEYPWPPANKPSTSPYPVSKALITAYLRSFAAHHSQPKLVIVCPGYCGDRPQPPSRHTTSRPRAERACRGRCCIRVRPSRVSSIKTASSMHSSRLCRSGPPEGYKKFAEEQAAAKAQAQGK